MLHNSAADFDRRATKVSQQGCATKVCNKSESTEEYLGRCLGRQPERDERQQRQQDAGNDEHDHVEDGNALDDDDERQIGVRLRAARVRDHLLPGRRRQQTPFVARHVARRVNLHVHSTSRARSLSLLPSTVLQ